MACDVKVRTCLWFDNDGLAAAKFYVSLVANSRLDIDDAETAPVVIPFSLGGAPFQIVNGGPHFKLNEAASICVRTADQRGTDRLWDALVSNGGEEGRCGWLKDRWGVSWQVVPARLGELLGSSDREAAERTQQAMMAMRKLDIARLERAFAGT